MDNTIKLIYGFLTFFIIPGTIAMVFERYSIPKGQNYNIGVLISSAFLTLVIPYMVIDSLTDGISFGWHLPTFILMYAIGVNIFIRLLKWEKWI